MNEWYLKNNASILYFMWMNDTSKNNINIFCFWWMNDTYKTILIFCVSDKWMILKRQY